MPPTIKNTAIPEQFVKTLKTLLEKILLLPDNLFQKYAFNFNYKHQQDDKKFPSIFFYACMLYTLAMPFLLTRILLLTDDTTFSNFNFNERSDDTGMTPLTIACEAALKDDFHGLLQRITQLPMDKFRDILTTDSSCLNIFQVASDLYCKNKRHKYLLNKIIELSESEFCEIILKHMLPSDKTFDYDARFNTIKYPSLYEKMIKLPQKRYKECFKIKPHSPIESDRNYALQILIHAIELAIHEDKPDFLVRLIQCVDCVPIGFEYYGSEELSKDKDNLIISSIPIIF
jgi:hypothetical protein